MGWLNLPLCESTAGTAALWPCCAARTNLAAPKQSMRRKVGRPLLPKARKEPRISCRSAAIRCRHNHVPTLDSHHAATYTVRFILTGTERPVCPRALGPILPQSHHDPRSTFFPRLPHEHNPPWDPSPGSNSRAQQRASQQNLNLAVSISARGAVSKAAPHTPNRPNTTPDVTPLRGSRCANSNSTRYDTPRHPQRLHTHTPAHTPAARVPSSAPSAVVHLAAFDTRAAQISTYRRPVCRLGSTGFDSDNGCALRSAHLRSSRSRCTLGCCQTGSKNKSANKFANT
jgi:hypothetical protein